MKLTQPDRIHLHIDRVSLRAGRHQITGNGPGRIPYRLDGFLQRFAGQNPAAHEIGGNSRLVRVAGAQQVVGDHRHAVVVEAVSDQLSGLGHTEIPGAVLLVHLKEQGAVPHPAHVVPVHAQVGVVVGGGFRQDHEGSALLDGEF